MANIAPFTTKGDKRNGTPNNDTMNGLAGADSLNGLGGNDFLEGGADKDTLVGGAGNDTLLGGDGIDLLNGDAGNDKLYGDKDNDILNGGSGLGADTLDGGAGADKMTGGDGNDYYFVDNAKDTIIEVSTKNGGVDTVETTLVNYPLPKNVENLVFAKTQDSKATGNDLPNKMVGNDANNALYGGRGIDTLKGGKGVDTLDGGTGIDELTGGDDSDIYIVDQKDEKIIEEENGGAADLVRSVVSFDLNSSDYVENLELSGTKAIEGTGNVLDNLIQEIDGNVNNIFDGAKGDDTLNGGGGDDTLEGGEGDDVINGGIGKDTARFNHDRSDYVIKELDDMGKIEVTYIGDDGMAEGTDILTDIEFLLFSDNDDPTDDKGLNIEKNRLTVDRNEVNEGESVTFKLVAPNAKEGDKIPFKFGGTLGSTISSEDVVGGLPTTNFLVGADNTAEITVSFINDIHLEKTEDLSITLLTGNTMLSTGKKVPVFASVSVKEVLPAAPVFDVIAGDDVIDSQEQDIGVVISGMAEANMKVALIFQNGLSSNPFPADSAGAWSYTLKPEDYKSGVSEITAIASDPIGHISLAASKTITLKDTLAPVAPVFDFVAGNDVIDSQEQLDGVVISGTAEANSTVMLTFMNNSSVNVSADKTGMWRYALISENYDAGISEIKATATDVSGNTSESASKSISFLDIFAPNAPVFDVVAGNDEITLAEKDAGVFVSGTAEANSVITLTFTNNASVTAFTDDAGMWRYLLTPENYEAGVSKIRATASDATGNVSPATSKIIKMEGRIPPTPTLALQNDNGDSADDGISTDGTLVISNLEAGATWTYSIDNGRSYLTNDATDNTIVLANGIYPAGSIRANQKDVTGNESLGVINEKWLMIGEAMSESSNGMATLLTTSGVIDAATGNVKFYFISALSDYRYEIDGFGIGDVLNFLNDSPPTIINDNFADNQVDVQWVTNDHVVTVSLTGLANDAALYGLNSFNTEFGVGSII